MGGVDDFSAETAIRCIIRMFSGIPGFYPLEASSTFLPSYIKQKCLQTWPYVSWGSESPQVVKHKYVLHGPFPSSLTTGCASPCLHLHQALPTLCYEAQSLCPVRGQASTYSLGTSCFHPLRDFSSRIVPSPFCIMNISLSIRSSPQVCFLSCCVCKPGFPPHHSIFLFPFMTKLF